MKTRKHNKSKLFAMRGGSKRRRRAPRRYDDVPADGPASQWREEPETPHAPPPHRDGVATLPELGENIEDASELYEQIQLQNELDALHAASVAAFAADNETISDNSTWEWSDGHHSISSGDDSAEAEFQLELQIEDLKYSTSIFDYHVFDPMFHHLEKEDNEKWIDALVRRWKEKRTPLLRWRNNPLGYSRLVPARQENFPPLPLSGTLPGWAENQLDIAIDELGDDWGDQGFVPQCCKEMFRQLEREQNEPWYAVLTRLWRHQRLLFPERFNEVETETRRSYQELDGVMRLRAMPYDAEKAKEEEASWRMQAFLSSPDTFAYNPLMRHADLRRGVHRTGGKRSARRRRRRMHRRMSVKKMNT